MVEAASDSVTGRANWSIVCALGAIALLSCALLLHAFSHVASAVAALVNRGEAVTSGKLLSALGVIDFALFAVTLATVAAVAVWEWRSRAVSTLLGTLNSGQAFILLTIVVGWCGQAYLYPGVLLGGDTGSHIARFLEMRRGLEGGSLAQWSNYDYLGSPLLGFTGPFTYVVGGLLDFLIRDPVATAKTLLFSTHLATGWAFYALLRRLNFAIGPSLIAAIGFSCSFALLHLFLYRGVFPQQFTIVFLVLTFYAAEGLMRGLPGRGRDWLLFALTTAGLVTNHQPHALFVAVYLGLYGVTSIAVGRWTIAKLPLLASAGAMGLAIATIAVVPIVVESDWVMINSDSGFLRLQWPTLQRLSQLILWRDTKTTTGIDYWAYVGLASTALGLFGGWAALSRRLGNERRNFALALLPGVIASFILFNPVVRDVMFIVFFVGLFAALGIEHLTALSRPGGKVLVLCFIAVVIDVASTSVQPVARTDKQFLIDAGHYLERSAASQRILEADFERNGAFHIDIGPGAGPVSYYSTVARVGGVHNMAATRVHNYIATIAKLAEADLRQQGRLSTETETLVGLLNASRIVCFEPATTGCPARFVGAEQEAPLGAVIHIRDATPAIFSQTLQEMAPPLGLDKPMLWDRQFEGPDPQVAAIQAFLERYVEAAAIDMHSHYSIALPVRHFPRTSKSLSPVGNSTWHARMTSYDVGLQRVSATIESSGPGYAQLAHPWYPATEVRINGRRVQPIEGALDFMVLPIETGVNVIEIRPEVTSIRIISAMVSGLALVVAFIVAAMLNYKVPEPSNG